MIETEFVQVAVEAPLAYPLTYRLPKDLAASASLGSRVKVPLGGRFSQGIVIGPTPAGNDTPIQKIKSIVSVSGEPAIGEKTFRWLKWLAQYYLHPPGQVYSLAFAPAGEVRKRKSKKTSPTDFGFDNVADPEVRFTPNEFQQKAIDEINGAVNAAQFEPFLLYGVTGSGKTEVYLHTIEQTLKQGKQALVLVPEISLTPQLIKRFVRRFGEKVAVLHSHLTERERADQWWSALKKEKQILIGARSALFCPLEDLGLIIVDEEHEGSFKQEEQLKYNARDAAIMRAQYSHCPIVLGSATPSLESWHNVQLKKYRLLTLPNRVENRPLPVIEVVDMRENKKNRNFDLPYWMSPKLLDEVAFALESKEQSALFLNRRGFAQFVICSSCGFTEQCHQCSVSLTVHGRGARLICHYCGFSKPAVEKCPKCVDGQLKPLGLGTEKVAEDLQILFPEARIACADRDEINSRESLENLLNRINRHEIDIIVGTQMIAKGHDFPNLTLVGVVLADVGLHFPDFRSSERTFQLLMQVAGRAGRHHKAGKVIVQTYVPEHAAIIHSTKHEFEKFADLELHMRDELKYPPFGKLASLRIQGAQLERVEAASDELRVRIERLQKMKPEFKGFEVLGPCEAPMSKLKGKHRYQLLLKNTSAKIMNVFLQHLMQDLEWLPSGVKVAVDMDPLQLL